MVLVGLALAACGAGCAAPLKMSDPAHHVPPQSLAAVPPFVASFEIDADSKYVKHGDWQQAARAALEASIDYDVQAHGGRFFNDEQLKTVDRTAFPDWAAQMLGEIMREAHLRQKGTETRHHTVFQWRYARPGLDVWRSFLGADYVMVSVFLDGQNTTGRSVTNALAAGFGGWMIDARREGLACVVNLIDGRVVWCALAPFGPLSVRERATAQLFVDQLTAGLFTMTSPSGLQPAPSVQPAVHASAPPAN